MVKESCGEGGEGGCWDRAQMIWLVRFYHAWYGTRGMGRVDGGTGDWLQTTCHTSEALAHGGRRSRLLPPPLPVARMRLVRPSPDPPSPSLVLACCRTNLSGINGAGGYVVLEGLLFAIAVQTGCVCRTFHGAGRRVVLSAL